MAFDRIATGAAPEGSHHGFFLDEGLQLTFSDGESAWQTHMTPDEAYALWIELTRQLAIISAPPQGSA